MIVPLAQLAQAGTLPGLMIIVLIRFALLLAVVWFTLRWPVGEFPLVVLWVLGAAGAGLLAALLLAPLFHASVLATALIRGGAELAVLLAMLNWRRMGPNSALSLIPAYVVVIGLAEYFLFR
jgi:hypothetical protein